MRFAKYIGWLTVAGVAVWAYQEGHFVKLGYFIKRLARQEDGVRLNRPLVDKTLKERFEKAGVAFPPPHTALVFFKDERELFLYAGPHANDLKLVHRYPVLAASGKVGPKLREGDRQVPEGFYRVAALNPKSRFHLALRLNYPNEIDRKHGHDENRSRLGGDIMIHGDAVSVGCLAIGDPAIEEVFRLAELTDHKKWEIILSPVDFRKRGLTAGEQVGLPRWSAEIYKSIAKRLSTIPDIPID